jgi:VanZ family protein
MATPARNPWLERSALALLAGYWLALFVGTHIPITPELIDVLNASDKTLHFTAYAGLAALLAANARLRGPLQLRHYVLVWGLTAAYGVVDEITQIPVGRTCDVRDWLADVSGSALALAAFALVMKLWPRSSENAVENSEPIGR